MECMICGKEIPTTEIVFYEGKELYNDICDQCQDEKDIEKELVYENRFNRCR